MNQTLTEIAFVLDRSDSMATLIEGAISGFNRLLREQQQAPGDARLTLVLFDDACEIHQASVPIDEIRPLTTRTFVPRGSTALLDAIAHTIDDLGARLAALPEPDRPGTVLVAILTDGYENASIRETWDSVSKRIRHQKTVYSWRFLFLAANEDAVQTAMRLEIDPADAASFSADSHSLACSEHAISRKFRALRAVGGGSASLEEQQIAGTSLKQLVQREMQCFS